MRNASNCNSSKTCNARMHELDEARGYAALMQLQPDTYTVESLAEKIGRSEKYVYARLRLAHLVDEIQQAFVGKLTVAHAFEIARLQPDDQYGERWLNASQNTGRRQPSSKTSGPRLSRCGRCATELNAKSISTFRMQFPSTRKTGT